MAQYAFNHSDHQQLVRRCVWRTGKDKSNNGDEQQHGSLVVRAENIGAAGGGLLGAVIAFKVDEGRQNSIQNLMSPFHAFTSKAVLAPATLR